MYLWFYPRMDTVTLAQLHEPRNGIEVIVPLRNIVGTRKTRMGLAAGSAVALMLLAGAAAPASANGGWTYRICASGTQVGGLSGYAAATTNVNNTACARAMVRDRYQWASGGSIAWTAWKYGASSVSAIAPSGSSGIGGQHTVEYPALTSFQLFST